MWSLTLYIFRTVYFFFNWEETVKQERTFNKLFCVIVFSLFTPCVEPFLDLISSVWNSVWECYNIMLYFDFWDTSRGFIRLYSRRASGLSTQHKYSCVWKPRFKNSRANSCSQEVNFPCARPLMNPLHFSFQIHPDSQHWETRFTCMLIALRIKPSSI